MGSNLAYTAYSQNSISIESSEKLIKMLYEGVLKFASQAKKAIELEDREKKVYWINRTVNIFSELINSLNYDEGDVAHYLSGIYAHQIRLLGEASMYSDIEKLNEVLYVTKTLLQAWNEETALVVD